MEDYPLPVKPACDAGVWFVTVGQKSMCGYCDHYRPHPAGGGQCADDPLRITQTWACRGFRFVPGIEELWEGEVVGDSLTD